ncbi:MAG: hypothetical protein DMF78_24070 [Acidobacteria bacterium]|nr:MAG: hypothetical protein DMF78_24070 [Acidobacteriota bacterium]
MAELIGTPSAIPFIVLRTVVVYVFILVGFRLSGKREVGQLAPYDFALILLIANAVQNAMVGPDTSLVGGLVAALMLLLLNYLLGTIAARNRKVEKLLRGKAHILVLRGHVYQDALESEHVTHEDLLQALRAHGCCTIADCRLAVLEVDGSISVVCEAPAGEKKTA